MNIYAISAMINFITSTALAYFIYSNNFKYKSYLFLNVSVAFWSFSYFLWQISVRYDAAFFFCRLLSLSAVFIPYFFLEFIIDIVDKKSDYKIVHVINLICLIAFSPLTFTPLMIRDIEPILSFSYWPKAGTLYILFLLYYSASLIASWIMMYKAYIINKNDKTKLSYITLATSVGLLGGITNYFLWYNIHIYPFGNIMASAYVLIMAYAILKHNLMDIKDLIKTGIDHTIPFLISLICLWIINDLLPIPQIYKYIIITLVGGMFIRYYNYRKHLEFQEKQAVLEEKLQRMSVLESMRQSISGCAHDLKNPLGQIEAFTNNLVRKLPRDVAKDEYISFCLEILQEATATLSTRIKDMLSEIKSTYALSGTFSQSAGNDRYSLVEAEAETAKRVLGVYSGIVNRDLPDTIYPAIPMNTLIIILSNLYTNAFAALSTASAPSITITARDLNEHYFLLEFADNGKGIPQEHQNKIFDLGYSTSGSSGIGLSWIRDTVSLAPNSGDITVKSTPDQGATFILKLRKKSS